MSAVLIDPALSEDETRLALYGGDLVFYSPRRASRALCNLAWEMIVDGFGPHDPERAQFELPVEEFAAIIGRIKPAFTHAPEAKRILRDLFEEVGFDPDATHFDVPKLRVVSTDGYLTAGMGYAYKAHRDIWYACPESQLNWWTPIRPITERCGLFFYPACFDRPVANNSEDFDAYRWNADGRRNAASFVHSDPRPHPHLQGEPGADEQILVGAPGSLTLFSAQHLHGTVPNDSGRTRFSIDFRTVHRDDVLNRRGAVLTDNRSTGTTLRDFMNATTHERFGEDVVAAHDDGSGAEDGVLVFDPETR